MQSDIGWHFVANPNLIHAGNLLDMHVLRFSNDVAMSAVTPKADMCSAPGDVRFVPEADMRLWAFENRKAAN